MSAPVLIVDYGSQYTQLIARRVRELGVRSRVIAPPESIEASARSGVWAEAQAVILSGGPNSVYAEGAPQLPRGFWQWQEASRTPVLGICYGLQLLVHTSGGEVRGGSVREYGRMEIVPESSRLFGERPEVRSVWMSHGDSVVTLPSVSGWRVSARSRSGGIAAVEWVERGVFGLQFHPEVAHSERGLELVREFVLGVAGIASTYSMRGVLEEQLESIRRRVGPAETVLCGLSGGVDSTVAAKLVSLAVGDRLKCVFVDHGLLRYRERERVLAMFEGRLGLNVRAVDEGATFLGALAGVSDPEAKRKIIGREFIRAFERAARAIQPAPRYLVQGTLYPDVIESAPAPGAGATSHAHTIKSHHNVGGLPADLNFELIEPLRDLFKDEVRRLGAELGIEADFLGRHPFPGPGLAVRILGEVTAERVEVLQRVDEIFVNELKQQHLYDQVWQAFAVLLPIKSVGVQGDGRTHRPVVALRAVHSSDGMTADWYGFEPKFLAHVSARICNEVREVGRVVYDISSKPPATIEWE